MTDQLPPLPPDQIRVALFLSSADVEIYGDFEASKLAHCMDDIMPMAAQEVFLPAPAKGTAEGVVIAREMLLKAVEDRQPQSDKIACIIGMWLCLYGTPHMPGFGLQIAEMEAAAGRGVLRVYDLGELYALEFDFAHNDHENRHCCGHIQIPRQTHWSKGAMGSA